MNRSQDGFTLLEFAVVVTIIGFVIAGILTARTMVRASELQNLLAEYDSYVKAVGEFNDKFLSLPGDMTNAETMWGSDTTCPNTAVSTTPHIPTCNGDGNGSIGTSDTSAALTNTREWWRAWQHLYNGGFIHTKVTGTVTAGGVQEAILSRNVPPSTIIGAGWTILYYLQLATNANLWGDQYGHIMTLGAFRSTSYTTGASISANEALAIDIKIDDGKPGTGMLRTWRTALLPNCTTNDTSQSAHTYNATNSDAQACSLIFLPGF